ncbi:MAG: LamG domain-containing protein [Nanoarchaeota archaeon]|nr:LamG domain-containing protein [Nanoarchaeota archaeon]
MKRAILIIISVFLLSVFNVHSDTTCTSISDAIAFYSFDSDCATDDSGNGYTLSGDSPNQIGTQYGNGCEFDGTEIIKNTALGSAIDEGDTICISLWLNVTDTGDKNMQVANFAKTGSEYFKAAFAVQNAAGDQIIAMDTYNGITQNFYADTAYTDNPPQWIHLAGCSDSNGAISLYYKDNVNISIDYTPTVTVSGLQEFALGANQFYYDLQADIYNFVGVIDEVWVFNCQLTNSQVNELYNGADFPNFNLMPNISNINCTSSGPEGDTTYPYETFDTTPSFNFKTNVSAYCRIGDTDINFSEMGTARNCTDTGATNHTCTLISDDELQYSNSSVYLRCINYWNSSLETGVTLNMSITLLEINATKRIQVGIDNSVIGSGAMVYTDQQVYLRGLLYDPLLTTVDKIAVFGNQRWLFNYNENNISLNLFNITPVVYSLELLNTPLGQIDEEVTEYIDSTKN